jgi:hypothetical protein
MIISTEKRKTPGLDPKASNLNLDWLTSGLVEDIEQQLPVSPEIDGTNHNQRDNDCPSVSCWQEICLLQTVVLKPIIPNGKSIPLTSRYKQHLPRVQYRCK